MRVFRKPGSIRVRQEKAGTEFGPIRTAGKLSRVPTVRAVAVPNDSPGTVAGLGKYFYVVFTFMSIARPQRFQLSVL